MTYFLVPKRGNGPEHSFTYLRSHSPKTRPSALADSQYIYTIQYLISHAATAVFPILYTVLTFHVPIFMIDSGEANDLLSVQVSFRLSPAPIIKYNKICNPTATNR